jgi:carbonic anhydrase
MCNKTSRRDLLRQGSGIALGVLGVSAVRPVLASPADMAYLAAAEQNPQNPSPSRERRDPPSKVLSDMLEGNARFVRGEARQPRRTPKDFQAVAETQKPRAAVITCADSRVTPEILFDQGIGDIFVVRIAGNAISGSGSVVKGSIEFAVAELGVSLVMVLGHSNCGAVKAAIQEMDSTKILPGSINELADAIKPAVALARAKPGDLLENSIRANVLRGVRRLENLDPIIAPEVRKGFVNVVGAVYGLKTGAVKIVEEI